MTMYSWWCDLTQMEDRHRSKNMPNTTVKFYNKKKNP